MSIALYAVLKTAIGEAGSLSSSKSEGELSAFVGHVAHLREMERAGVIQILDEQREQETGKQYVCRMEFRRLR
jgi:hypothetical protein